MSEVCCFIVRYAVYSQCFRTCLLSDEIFCALTSWLLRSNGFCPFYMFWLDSEVVMGKRAKIFINKKFRVFLLRLLVLPNGFFSLTFEEPMI